jgi:hypothetical protein
MTQAEVRATIAAYSKAWAEEAPGREPTHDLMIGVLATADTLAGKKPGKFRRYPRVEDIADIFVTGPRVLNLVHYAGNKSPENLLTLRAAAGPRCDGYQFNGSWPEHGDMATLCGEHRQERPFTALRIVLQTRTLDFSTASAPLATDLLLDLSGGKGIPIDLPAAVRMLRHSPWSRGIGLAGGFCAESLPPAWLFAEAAGVSMNLYGLSLDAEGKVRDDADGGGNLSVDKVTAYLRAFVARIVEASPR